MKNLFLLFLTLTFVIHAQEQFQNTMLGDSTMVSPKAPIGNLDWLQGLWQGEALGGTVQTIWSPPLGGSMMGAFKLVQNNEVVFYEIITLVEEKGTLVTRLKHFHPDLTGWEDKDTTVDFRLLNIKRDRTYFDGMTLEKVSDSTMNIYVILGSKEGGNQEMKFEYTKID